MKTNAKCETRNAELPDSPASHSPATSLLTLFEAAIKSPETLPPDYPAGACTVEVAASPIPSASAPGAEKLSSADCGTRIAELVVLAAAQQASMALAFTRAEFVNSRGALAGVVAAAQILLTPENFAELLQRAGIDALTLAELREIAGTSDMETPIEV